jgi:hypothetical protein
MLSKCISTGRSVRPPPTDGRPKNGLQQSSGFAGATEEDRLWTVVLAAGVDDSRCLTGTCRAILWRGACQSCSNHIVALAPPAHHRDC